MRPGIAPASIGSATAIVLGIAIVSIVSAIALLAIGTTPAEASAEIPIRTIRTNELVFENAPTWVTQNRIERIVDRVQDKLEWTTRRTTVRYFADSTSFANSHSLGPHALAVTSSIGGSAKILLGPKVTNSNFDQALAHELVHVIVVQKYKGAIPKWLEEGLANHLARAGQVDYKWLAKQTMPRDVRELAHPMLRAADSGRTMSQSLHFRYQASQALAEMLDKKCDLLNLVRMSVGKNMETYIGTMCEIKDLTKAFQDWITKKAKGF
jgi:hypothetical protein